MFRGVLINASAQNPQLPWPDIIESIALNSACKIRLHRDLQQLLVRVDPNSSIYASLDECLSRSASAQGSCRTLSGRHKAPKPCITTLSQDLDTIVVMLSLAA